MSVTILSRHGHLLFWCNCVNYQWERKNEGANLYWRREDSLPAFLQKQLLARKRA